MRHFELEEREEFAELIVNAAGLNGTDAGNDFIKSFRGVQEIYGSNVWRDKVVSWIRGKGRNEIKNLIRNNPQEARAVLQKIEENLRHF